MPGLHGRIVWVTGAGSGIGRATAIAFAAAGAQVALTGRRADALAETAEAIGQNAMVVPADLADPAQVTEAHATVAGTWGAVEILVNNAGFNTARRHFRSMGPAELGATLDINLRAPFLCTLAVLPAMRARNEGTIIHIASLAGTTVFPAGGAAYGTSKAALRQMSALLNAEEGIHGIRSVCINPGEVATPIMERRARPPSQAERALMLQAEDVAAAAVFAAGLPPRATVADMTILPTDNQVWRSSAQAIAEG